MKIEIGRPGLSERDKLERVTHLAIVAHADDIEIMAIEGILKAKADPKLSFAGIVMTDGRGSPRTGAFADVSDEEMAALRIEEQLTAAELGEYARVEFMGFTSSEIRRPGNAELIEALVELIEGFDADVIYTHSLADKHPTHVAVCLRVIEALRRVEKKPGKVIGCEAWRGLDWLADEDKVLMDTSDEPLFQAELLKAHRSQIEGGKNYVEAALGRRAANATFLDPYAPDEAAGLVYGMDLMPLLDDAELEPRAYMKRLLQKFEDEVLRSIEGLL